MVIVAGRVLLSAIVLIDVRLPGERITNVQPIVSRAAHNVEQNGAILSRQVVQVGAGGQGQVLRDAGNPLGWKVALNQSVEVGCGITIEGSQQATLHGVLNLPEPLHMGADVSLAIVSGRHNLPRRSCAGRIPLVNRLRDRPRPGAGGVIKRAIAEGPQAPQLLGVGDQIANHVSPCSRHRWSKVMLRRAKRKNGEQNEKSQDELRCHFLYYSQQAIGRSSQK